MERNFDNRDFEQYLKKNADQYKMYPSGKVWEEIHHSLHPRRRWAGVAALLLLITGSIVTTVMVLSPASSKNQIATQEHTVNSIATQKTATPVSNKKITEPILKNVNQVSPIASNRIPSILQDNTFTETNTPINENIINDKATSIVAAPELNKPEPQQSFITTEKTGTKIKTYFPAPVSADFNDDITSPVISKSGKKTTIDPSKQNTISLFASSQNEPAVVQKAKEKKKISFQVYFTPGVSYRRLTENKEAILAASGGPTIPTNLALEDVKNVVKHKPDAGFELGLAVRYPLSKRITLKTGIQFNVNKYDIRAFSYSGEPATIAIQGGTPNQQTVTRTSYYRNSSGYRPNWLTNVYFSLSVPVGAEVKLLDGKKVDLGIGITGQPTYLLDDRAYMISTDYKNYVKVPDLIRRWNVNAGAEIIVAIKSKRTSWHIGPQVRYQALSSFKDKYPVKENLFNFGLKAGITLNQ